MSTEANRATAIKMVETMGADGIDESLLTDDVCWWVPGRGTIGKREFFAMAEGFKSLLAGPLRLEVRGVTADGDRVAVEAESFAELTNGKVYNNTYHFLFLFRDGKIYLAKEYNDSAHAAEVLGGFPASG